MKEYKLHLDSQGYMIEAVDRSGDVGFEIRQQISYYVGSRLRLDTISDEDWAFLEAHVFPVLDDVREKRRKHD